MNDYVNILNNDTSHVLVIVNLLIISLRMILQF